MENGIIKTTFNDRLTPAQERGVIQSWDALRKSQREMFIRVAAAVKKREGLASAGNMEFEDWASRYDIAAEYGREILIPSRVKLLNDLVKQGFLVTRERRNGSYVDGRWRPHNSSWVYKPAPGILTTLAAAAEIREGAKMIAKKPAPKKRFSAPDRSPAFATRSVPTPYEQYHIGDSPEVKPAKKPESVLKRLWSFLGSIDPF